MGLYRAVNARRWAPWGTPQSLFATMETLLCPTEIHWGHWCACNRVRSPSDAKVGQPHLVLKGSGAHCLGRERLQAEHCQTTWKGSRRVWYTGSSGTQRKECLCLDKPERLCRRGAMWEPWRASGNLTGKEGGGFPTAAVREPGTQENCD